MSARDKQELGEALAAINRRVDRLAERFDALIIRIAEIEAHWAKQRNQRAA